MINGGKILPTGGKTGRSYYSAVTFSGNAAMLHNGSTTYNGLSTTQPNEPYISTLYCDYSSSSAANVTVNNRVLRPFVWVARIVHNFNRLPAFSVYNPSTGATYSGLSASVVKYNTTAISNNAVDIKFQYSYYDSATVTLNATLGTGGSVPTETFNVTSTTATEGYRWNNDRFFWAVNATASVLCKVTTQAESLSVAGGAITANKIFSTADSTTDTTTQTLGAAGAAVTLVPLDNIPYVFVTVA